MTLCFNLLLLFLTFLRFGFGNFLWFLIIMIEQRVFHFFLDHRRKRMHVGAFFQCLFVFLVFFAFAKEVDRYTEAAHDDDLLEDTDKRRERPIHHKTGCKFRHNERENKRHVIGNVTLERVLRRRIEFLLNNHRHEHRAWPYTDH